MELPLLDKHSLFDILCFLFNIFLPEVILCEKKIQLKNCSIFYPVHVGMHQIQYLMRRLKYR